MAFSDAQPDWNISTNGRLDQTTFRVVNTSTRRFTCLVSDINNDTPIRAKQQHVFPIEGDSDPDDQSMICVSSEVKRLGMTALECIANYESIATDTDVGQQNSIIAGWTFGISFEEAEEPVDRARDVFPRDGRNLTNINSGKGLAITTIAGESYDPPLTDRISDLVLTFTTTNRPPRFDLLALYVNCVNSDTFLGFPAGRCRIRQPTGTQTVQSDGTVNMNVSVSVAVRSAAPGSIDHRAWWTRVRAEGYYALDFNAAANGEIKKVRVLDDYGEPVVKPALHYAAGAASQRGVQIFGSDAHEKAEFYEFQPPSLVYRPFNAFFQAIVAGSVAPSPPNPSP